MNKEIAKERIKCKYCGKDILKGEEMFVSDKDFICKKCSDEISFAKGSWDFR